MGFGYVKEEPVFAGDREISAVPLFGPATPSAAAPARTAVSASVPGRLQPAAACNGAPSTRTLTSGTLHLRRGQSCAYMAQPRLPVDGFNFAPDNYLLTPQERVGVRPTRSVDITDNIRFNTTILYNERAPSSCSRRCRHPGHARPGPIPAIAFISANSIYNPFGGEVTRSSAVSSRPRPFVRAGRRHVLVRRGLRRHVRPSARRLQLGSRLLPRREPGQQHHPACSTSSRCEGLGPSFLDAAASRAAARRRRRSPAASRSTCSAAPGSSRRRWSTTRPSSRTTRQLQAEELLRQHHRRPVRPAGRPAGLLVRLRVPHRRWLRLAGRADRLGQHHRQHRPPPTVGTRSTSPTSNSTSRCWRTCRSPSCSRSRSRRATRTTRTSATR